MLDLLACPSSGVSLSSSSLVLAPLDSETWDVLEYASISFAAESSVSKPLVGRTQNGSGKRAGFCRSARPLIRPSAFILSWPAVAVQRHVVVSVTSKVLLVAGSSWRSTAALVQSLATMGGPLRGPPSVTIIDYSSITDR